MSEIVTNVRVSLSSFAHDYPADVDVLLVGPGGQSVMFLSDAGGSAFADANLSFNDANPGSVPDPIVSGFYKPTNVDDGSLDVFPWPAPLAPFGSALSVFDGVDANGPWSLYVVDDDEFAGGAIGSWRVHVTGRPPAPTGFTSVPPVSEKAGAVRVTVTRRTSTAYAARVGYQTEPMPTDSANTATAGLDYTPVSGTLDFSPGENFKTFDVPIVNDRLREPENDRFLIRLTQASGDAAPGVWGSFPSVQTVEIVDDEPDATAPRISGRAVQRVLRQRGVIMTVRFNLDGTVRASGKVPLPRGAAAVRSVRLTPVKRSVTAGVPVKLKLRLSQKALRAVRRTLRQTPRLTANVKAVGIDRARTTPGEIGKRRFKLTR